MNVEQLVARLQRRLRPPRIRRVSSRPAGWLAVGHRHLEPIVAWALLENDQVIPLVADRRGLRPATGRKFRGGYLPGAARSAADVQPAPPAVSVCVADLEEAIGPLTDTLLDAIYSTRYPNEIEWRELDAVYKRLEIAAKNEWAVDAVCTFVAEPRRFLRRHLELVAEHVRPAALADVERDWLASLMSSKSAAAAGEEVSA